MKLQILNSFIQKIILLFLIIINPFGLFANKITAKKAFKLGAQITHEIKSVPNIKSFCSTLLDNKQITKGYAPIEDGNLYYEIEGKGIPIVLLNPGPGGTHHFYHPYFSDAAKFAQIIYYDMRGTGQSGQSEDLSKYSIKQAIKDLENLRKFLKIKKWVVLGWSFGGFLAECYSLTHPENILGLILVASDIAGFNQTNFGQSRQKKYIHKEEQERIHKIMSQPNLSEEEIIYNINLNGDWKRQQLYKPSNKDMARMALYEWKPAINFRDIIGFDRSRILFNKEFDDFAIPTLIIEGTKDLTFSKNKPNLFIQQHPKAKSIIFKNAAHKIFEDEQEKFFIEINKFINPINLNTIFTIKNKFNLPESNSLIYEIATTNNKEAEADISSVLFSRSADSAIKFLHGSILPSSLPIITSNKICDISIQLCQSDYNYPEMKIRIELMLQIYNNYKKAPERLLATAHNTAYESEDDILKFYYNKIKKEQLLNFNKLKIDYEYIK